MFINKAVNSGFSFVCRVGGLHCTASQTDPGPTVITLFRGVGGEGEVAGCDEAAPPGADRHPCVVHHHQRQLERGHPHRVHIAVVLSVPGLQQIIQSSN